MWDNETVKDHRSEFQVRQATDADLDEILGVLTQSFDDWPKGRSDVSDARQHLLWKCQGTDRSIGCNVVALHEGTMVAATLRIPRQVKLGGEIMTSQSGGDTSVVPHYRGRGLHGLMQDFGFDAAERGNFDFHLKFGEHAATVPSWERRGLIYPRNTMRVLFKPVDAMRAARVAQDSWRWLPRPLLAAGIKFASMSSARSHGRDDVHPDDGNITALDRFDTSVDELWESASADFDLIPVRDKAFLNWRYCDRRGGHYMVRTEQDEHGLAGYCVLAFAGERAYVVDILARTGHMDTLKRLLSDAENVASERGAVGLFCQLHQRHPYERALLGRGFFDTRKRSFFGVIPYGIDPERLDILDSAALRIHAMYGDSDLI